MPRGEEQAAFYHFTFQEYLAAERLHTQQIDLGDCLKQHAATPDWRRTLLFLFASVADQRPQAALQALERQLLPQLELPALIGNPYPALLLLDCLDIAHARQWGIAAFAERLWATCQQVLDSDLAPMVKNALWLSAGKLGIDNRPGVGLTPDECPDIEWCPVAPGQLILEDHAGRFDVPGFSIAKYPITNAQFSTFVKAADCYRNPEWWESGWPEQGWVDLTTPPSSRWNEPNAPREVVSWHEAVAFCRWLNHRLRATGKLTQDQQVRLPTEWEWQLAATGGDQNRTYPWGPDWDSDRLNSREGDVDRTSAVGIYPAGIALYGALDMEGNVWEWCLNKYDDANDTRFEGTDIRVVRGGSWINNQHNCRAAYRNRNNPN